MSELVPWYPGIEKTYKGVKKMKLTKNGQIVLVSAFVVALLLSGLGLVEANSARAAYEEQSKQMQLYKEELNEAQSELKENDSYKALYECVQAERDSLQKQVDELSKWKSLGQFTITFYWPGEDRYGKLTSTGTIAQEGKTIAVDPSIIPYGSIVLINGNEYVAQDCGGAIKGNKIDVFVENPKHQKYTVEVFLKK